jgi:hypothetical protein
MIPDCGHTYFLHLLRAQFWANSEMSRMHGGPQHMSKRVRQSTYPCRPDDKQQSTTLVTKEILNSLSTKPKNRTTVGVATTISAVLRDGPAWLCTGLLCPCIRRQPPRKHQPLPA